MTISQQTNNTMNPTVRNILIGGFYILLFLVIAPALFGVIVGALCWAPSGWWMPFIFQYIIGLLPTAILITPLIPRMYIINDAFTVSFHLDPFFGSRTMGPHGETLQLVWRGPKFHFIGFWEDFDSTTEHEKEIRIPLKGKFETKGDTLNLEIVNGVLVMKAPMESAPLLRAVAKGMDEIKREIESQLGPALKQATAEEFIKRNSDAIMKDQSGIAHLIRGSFEKRNQTANRYGLVTQKFVLGDVNFSDKINDAREAAKASELRMLAAKKAQQEMEGDLSAKDALDFVLINEGKTRHHIWEVKGISSEAIAAAKTIAGAVKGKGKKSGTTT